MTDKKIKELKQKLADHTAEHADSHGYTQSEFFTAIVTPEQVLRLIEERQILLNYALYRAGYAIDPIEFYKVRDLDEMIEMVKSPYLAIEYDEDKE